MVPRLRVDGLVLAGRAGTPDLIARLGEFDDRADGDHARGGGAESRGNASQTFDDVGIDDVAEIAWIGRLHPPQGGAVFVRNAGGLGSAVQAGPNQPTFH